MLGRTNPELVIQLCDPGVPDRHHEEANPRDGPDHRADLRNRPTHVAAAATAVSMW